MKERIEKIREHIERSMFIFLPLLLTLVCFFPIVSGTSTNGETATFVIRGYDLLNFSPWSAITLMAPILLLLIIFADAEYHTKEILMLALIIISVVGFLAGFNGARIWLYKTCNSMIEYHIEGFTYPLVLPFLTINIWLTKNVREEKEEEKELC